MRIVEVEDGVRFAVRVQPRAKKNQVCGAQGDAIKVRVVAPPVDGAANAALIVFLAAQLGVRKSALHIVTGATARNKVIEARGISAHQVRERLVEPSR